MLPHFVFLKYLLNGIVDRHWIFTIRFFYMLPLHIRPFYPGYKNREQGGQSATYHAPQYSATFVDILVRAAILVGWKNTNLVEILKIWHLSSIVEFCSAVLEEVKCLSQSEAGAAILIFPSAWKIQTWKMTLSSWFLSRLVDVEFRSAVSEKKSKMSQR